MNTILALAANTYKEAIRDKVLYIIIFFALAFIASSLLLYDLSMRQDVKIIKDMGLGSISAFGTIITLFLGSNMLFKEIDKKTIYNILSKPIKRSHFIFGKFFGLAFVLLLISAGLAFVFWGVMTLKGEAFSSMFLISIFLSYLKLLFLTSFVIFFSTFTSPILTMFLSIGVFIIGHITEHLKSVANGLENESMAKILDAAYYLLPNFNINNIQNSVVYNIDVDIQYIIIGIGYTLLYTLLILMLSAHIFNKKEF